MGAGRGTTRAIGRWALRGAIALGAALFLGWGALGLHFAGPRPPALADALAGAWVLAGLGALALVRPGRRALVAFALIAALWLAWWVSLRPRNDRDWLPDVARTSTAELQGDRLTVHDLRNFDYRSESDFTPRWETRTFDLARLSGLDLFMSYWGSPAIAHTIMSWAFDDGQHLAISIETRKERGEAYSAIAGFFKQYELYYVVADERDVVRLRTNDRGEEVHLYLLRTPLERARRLLLDYVARIDKLAAHPAFYNAATANCTTTIRTHVRGIGVAMPWDWRLLMNGHLDEMLYERGVVDTSRPFAEIRRASLVNARAQAADQDPAFSARIREGLVRPPFFAAAPAQNSRGRREGTCRVHEEMATALPAGGHEPRGGR
jgi:Domain of unknown function (DUF4105)